MKLHLGIVLKVPTSRQQSYVVMDNMEGKILINISRMVLQAGSLISYHVQRKKTFWNIESIELVHVPCELAKNDILFLHHLLELCYYCLPIGSCARNLVDLFCTIYQMNCPVLHIIKKSIVLKLLVLLGIYPEEMILRFKNFHVIATESIDTITQAILNLGIEEELDQWLKSCITCHPHAQYFKTLSFYQ